MILKSDSVREKDKKKDVNILLGSNLADERFAVLVNLCKKITDFNPNEEDVRENVCLKSLSGLNASKSSSRIPPNIVSSFFDVYEIHVTTKILLWIYKGIVEG